MCKPAKVLLIPIGTWAPAKVEKDASAVERFLRMRILGVVEACDILLQFPLKESSVEVIYLEVPYDTDSMTKVMKRRNTSPLTRDHKMCSTERNGRNGSVTERP